MKKILINTLSQNGFIVLNKSLIKRFNSLNLACVLSFFIDKWAYFNGEDFFYTIENIQDDTFLSERNIRDCIKKLIQMKILIKKEFTGLPPKQYYNINYKMVINILNDSEIPCKNDTFNPCKNDRVNHCDSDRDIIDNKNKDIKNKNNKNKDIKKNTKKSLREDCISLFEDSKNEIKHFNLDDWLEWVDYKLAKETKITLATFKKNLKQLVNFGENAKQSIDTSISSNWSGLFAIRTQKDVKQGVSMPKDNKSDFRGVSVQNKEECNWFLDFLKGDDKE